MYINFFYNKNDKLASQLLAQSCWRPKMKEGKKINICKWYKIILCMSPRIEVENLKGGCKLDFYIFSWFPKSLKIHFTLLMCSFHPWSVMLRNGWNRSSNKQISINCKRKFQFKAHPAGTYNCPQSSCPNLVEASPPLSERKPAKRL